MLFSVSKISLKIYNIKEKLSIKILEKIIKKENSLWKSLWRNCKRTHKRKDNINKFSVSINLNLLFLENFNYMDIFGSQIKFSNLFSSKNGFGKMCFFCRKYFCLLSHFTSLMVEISIWETIFAVFFYFLPWEFDKKLKSTEILWYLRNWSNIETEQECFKGLDELFPVVKHETIKNIVLI